MTPKKSKAAAPASVGESSLVGRICTWTDGAPSHQGVILAVVPTNAEIGDLALIEYFEWFSGSATYQRLIPLSALAAAGDVRRRSWRASAWARTISGAAA